MKGYTWILFDMDGTLADSEPGIVNGVKYVLKKTGRDIPPDEELRYYLGPPLKESFCKMCGVSKEEGFVMSRIFREYYADRGIYESCAFPGVEELLRELKQEGFHLAVATSKTEDFARTITEHIGLLKYMDFIGGGSTDGKTRCGKYAVVEHVIKSCGIKNRGEVLMVGDRCYDIEGAHRAGIRAAGVLYGYGDAAELTGAGADYLCPKPEDVLQIVRISTTPHETDVLTLLL